MRRTASRLPGDGVSLHRGVRRWGWVLIGVYGTLLPLSYGVAALSTFRLNQKHETQLLRHFVDSLPLLPEAAVATLQRFVSIDTFLQSTAWRAGIYSTLFLIATIAACRVLLLLARHRNQIDQSLVSRLLRTSLVFAAVNLLAYPTFTRDFWLSVTWGRMIVDGVNPYYSFFTPEALHHLPLKYFKLRMTYGPLWGLLSAAVTLLAMQRVVVEFLLFKLILAGFWILCLWLINQIAATRSPFHAGVAVCLFGWLPMSSHFTIAEGHNDVAMVTLLVLWLYLIFRGRHLLSPFALASSALMKYVTAPLVVLELWDGFRRRSCQPLSYMVALAISSVLVVLVVLLFARDLSFLDATRNLRHWRLLTPSQWLVDFAAMFFDWKISTQVADMLVLTALAFPLGAALWRYWRGEDSTDFAIAVFVAVSAAALVVVGHTWPWYLLWPLATGAIVWRCSLMQFVFPLFLLSPFVWILAQGGRPDMPNATLLFYGAALVIFWPCRSLLKTEEAAPLRHPPTRVSARTTRKI